MLHVFIRFHPFSIISYDFSTIFGFCLHFFLGCFPCWWTVETENSQGGFLSLSFNQGSARTMAFCELKAMGFKGQVVGGLLVLVYLVLLWCYITVIIYLCVTVSDVRQCLWRRMFTIYIYLLYMDSPLMPSFQIFQNVSSWWHLIRQETSRNIRNGFAGSAWLGSGGAFEVVQVKELWSTSSLSLRNSERNFHMGW